MSIVWKITFFEDFSPHFPYKVVRGGVHAPGFRIKLNFNKLLVTQRFRSTTRNRLRIKTNISIFYVCYNIFALRHVISNKTRQNKQSFPTVAKQITSKLTKKLAKSTIVNLTSFTLFISLPPLLIKLSACYPLDVHCKISYL